MTLPLDSYIFSRTRKAVKNRTVLAAMTNKQSHQNGVISDAEIKWLKIRAKGGFGIITTAAANISEDGKAWEGEIGMFDDMHIDRLTELARSIHSHGSLLLGQLFHGGMRSPQKLTGTIPISASKIECDISYSGYTHSVSSREISKLITDFTSAAVRCHESGFDGVELHGAHGYLISQFLGKKTNFRNDIWGQDLCGRSKLLKDIYLSIKQNVPDSFIVGIRLSPEIKDMGIYLNDTMHLISRLSDMGVDFIHLSCWDVFADSGFFQQKRKTYTEIITENYNNLPTIISTGSVWSYTDAQDLILQGADLIGVARVGIAYPDWPKNLIDDGYKPKLPPFTIQHLKEAGLSDVFIDYMRNWKGFVIDE